jgi:hypothetical protein
MPEFRAQLRWTRGAALRTIMVRAQASGVLAGRPAELAEQFAGLLWGDLMLSLLLGDTYVPLLMITHVVAFYLLLRREPKVVRVLVGNAAAA